MIHLIRHTKPEVAAGICYGQTDVPVAESFDDELRVIAKKLQVTPETVVFSSPLQRCRKLANTLFNESQVKIDDQLMEMHFGDWEMQAWKNLDQDILTHWGNNFVTMPSPNGESLECVQLRVLAFWSRLDLLNKDYVLLTHSGVIRVILMYLLEAPLAKAFTLDVQFGEVIRISVIDQHNYCIRFI